MEEKNSYMATGGQNTDVGGSAAGNPYAGFKGSSYDDVISFLNDRIAEYKPETEAERKLREKREKREMFLSNIADTLGSMHKAYSYQRGVKPMELADVSAKTRERIDKAKAERQNEKDRIMNYAITLGNLKDKDRAFNFQVTQAEQAQNNWREQFDASRNDRKEDVAFRNANFEEGKRQFNVNSAEQARHNKASESLQGASLAEQRRHNKAAEGLESRRIAESEDGKYTEFYVPNGGMIKVRNSALNSHNLSYVFNQTPVEGRPQPSYNLTNGQSAPVSADQMLQHIGQHIDDQNVQNALRNIGGQTAGNDNTPPSRRNKNDNTPPSRR